MNIDDSILSSCLFYFKSVCSFDDQDGGGCFCEGRFIAYVLLRFGGDPSISRHYAERAKR